MAEQSGNGQGTALATTSTRFVAKVEQEFEAQMGSGIKWTDYQKTLAQHLFLKCDMQFKQLEADRANRNSNNPPIVWDNINLQKLALDGVHRVCLGLDALMRNHIHPIPYLNRKTGKYDVDLQIGYEGKDYCRRKLAVTEPVEVIYQLVYETDTFVPHMKDHGNEVESYEFKINNAFDRGKVIGGFGYIKYEDPTLNRLVLVTQRDFARSKSSAPSNKFWDRDDLEMMYKTIVHRTTEKIPMDPTKANAPSYAYVEAQEAETNMERLVESEGNGDVIDIKPEPPTEEPSGFEPEPEPEPAMNGAEKQGSLGPDF